MNSTDGNFDSLVTSHLSLGTNVDVGRSVRNRTIQSENVAGTFNNCIVSCCRHVSIKDNRGSTGIGIISECVVASNEKAGPGNDRYYGRGAAPNSSSRMTSQDYGLRRYLLTPVTHHGVIVFEVCAETPHTRFQDADVVKGKNVKHGTQRKLPYRRVPIASDCVRTGGLPEQLRVSSRI